MSIFDRLSSLADSALAWLVTSLLAGCAWLVRRVFTNQKQIELLQAEMRHRDKLRAEDREDMAEVKRGVERIEGLMMKAVKGGDT